MPCFKQICVHSCVIWLAGASVEGMVLCLIKHNTLYHMAARGFLFHFLFYIPFFFPLKSDFLFFPIYFFISSGAEYSLFSFYSLSAFISCLMGFNLMTSIIGSMLFLLFSPAYCCSTLQQIYKIPKNESDILSLVCFGVLDRKQFFYFNFCVINIFWSNCVLII